MWLYVSVIVGIAIVAAAVVVSFVRWFFIRPRRMRLPEGSIEELNRFAREFRRAAEYMNELSKTLELRSLFEWQRKNEEILKTLHQMNRLLKELNEFFEVEATELGRTDTDEEAQAPEGSPSGRPPSSRERGRGGRRSL
jgi:hypothetical protein